MRSSGLRPKLGVMVVPPVRDLQPCREPDAALGLCVVEEVGERRDAAGLAYQTRMQADAHHARMGRAFVPWVVEAAFAQVVKVAGTAIAFWYDEGRVVVGEGLGHE